MAPPVGTRTDEPAPAPPTTPCPTAPPVASPTNAGTTSLRFTGAALPPAPLTWGQQAIWIAFRRHGAGQVMITLRRTLRVPRQARADVPTVLTALGALLARHSSLRTRLRPDAEGAVVQEVAADGELPVRLVGADGTGTADGGAEVARSTAEELAATPFDHGEEWPQRVALVLVGGQVRQVVLVFSHTTVDFQAAQVILRDLRLLLLRGGIDTPAGLQSVDVARREQDPQHRRRAERAASYWVTQFTRLPTDTLPRVGPRLSPRFQRAVLSTSAADVAVRLIANRAATTSSTVLLAAVATVAAAWSGQDVVGIHTMANNRALPGYRDAIAKLNQLGLVVVDLADRPDFAALLPRVWQAAVTAYRHAYHDPIEMTRAFRAAGLPYATGVSPHYYLNDIRLCTDTDLFGRATGEAEVRAAQAASTLTWTPGYDSFTWRARVEIVDQPGAIGLALTADTGHLPPEAMTRFLRDLEGVLVEAAFRDLPWPWR